MPSGQTIPVGVDFIHRIQSEHPVIIATGNGIVIASRLTSP
jgi:hypothetical protein